ncbi:MAG: OsmC family protein [Anaerolineae bacterium]|nr:OsmC family protein [Anaerolineae bacterium]
MTEVNINWLHQKTFVGTDSTNHSVVISSKDDGVGMKPSDLLLVALGSCTAYDVVNILEKKRANVNHVRVTVCGEQGESAPWAFHKIHIHYTVSGTDVRTEDVAKAIELSERKYCSVSATLKSSVDISYDFEIIEVACPEAQV